MGWFSAVGAVLFDCDGTLVDSERLGGEAIAEVVRAQGVDDTRLDYSQLHGLRWSAIAQRLVARFPALAEVDLAAAFQRGFNRRLRGAPPPLIPGTREAVLAASDLLPTAVVSSGDREDVELALQAHGLLERFAFTVCAEDCSRSKPDPQGFLLAAQRLGVTPQRCLVFEDSEAGLQAARAAKMSTVAIASAGTPDRLEALADRCVPDYTALPRGFFAAISAGRARP
jgi:HAD superfamily hydrolase (TIGR01509 family)